MGLFWFSQRNTAEKEEKAVLSKEKQLILWGKATLKVLRELKGKKKSKRIFTKLSWRSWSPWACWAGCDSLGVLQRVIWGSFMVSGLNHSLGESPSMGEGDQSTINLHSTAIKKGNKSTNTTNLLKSVKMCLLLFVDNLESEFLSVHENFRVRLVLCIWF